MKKSTVPYSYGVLIKTVLAYLRPYRGRFWFGSFFRLSGDLVFLYSTYALSAYIAAAGRLAAGGSPRIFWFWFIGWAVGAAYAIITRQIGKLICYQIAEKINLDSQLKAIRHLEQLDIAWHEKENTGNKLKRVQSGGEGLERLVRIWVDNLTQITVNFIGMIVIIAFTDLAVAGIMVVFLLTYFLAALPLARRASAASREVNQHEEDFTGLAFEIINNVRTVKVMDMFTKLAPRLADLSATVFRAVQRRIRRFRFKSWVQGIWAHGFRIMIVVLIVWGIMHGRYDVSFLLLFNFYFTNVRQSAEELAEVSQDITIARYNIARLEEILREPIRIDREMNKVDFPAGWKTISLRHVSFAYGQNPVLKDISFDIRRGEKIGIVGLSGAGKSTLFKLLFKEYENFTGDILFDDVSIRDIKKSSYFERVAVVLQDTEVFNFSLRDNITIAGASPTEEQLRQALQIAHVNDFLPKLRQGLETLIGEKGIKLSGGERQRVGIARAIVRQPDILFLDEATSHLDLESEEKIKDSLHRFFQDVTAIVIAHRLTTIQEMDRILLIEDGELREAGNFKTLHQKRGRFFELWEKQKL